jgi:tRNA dimethylallyltransferase
MIGGPTGSGKTDLAMEVAKRRGWEILSADSGQSRRGLEIGTASPTGPQRERIRHHLVGDLEPETPDSVVSFLDRTEAVLATSGPDLLVVGGTCQYLEALSRGMDAVPPPDAAVREVLAERLKTEGHAALWNELKSREASPPPDAVQNPVRLLRALEKSIQAERGFLGQSRSALAPNTPLVALAWPREALHRRLAERLEAMLVRAGWRK